MSKSTTTDREDITFEQGYEELKSIVARLNEDDVPVHEMFEGFRRGKGLEQALRSYLTEREGELTEIEQGDNLPEFNIVAPSGRDQDRASRPDAGGESELVARSSSSKESRGTTAIDEEIPF
jgi:exodeoxyribonuclease VII small subunit